MRESAWADRHRHKVRRKVKKINNKQENKYQIMWKKFNVGTIGFFPVENYFLNWISLRRRRFDMFYKKKKKEKKRSY